MLGRGEIAALFCLDDLMVHERVLEAVGGNPHAYSLLRSEPLEGVVRHQVELHVVTISFICRRTPWRHYG